MSHAVDPAIALEENRFLDKLGGRLKSLCFVVGAIGLGLAAYLGQQQSDEWRNFFFSYLLAFSFFLTITLGGLFFVIIQHVVKAGWSVVVRRLAELLAANMPVLLVLSLPIVIPVVSGSHALYIWNDPSVVSESALLQKKVGWLEPKFFAIRIVIYFVIWTILAWFYLSNSVRQDENGDPQITRKLERFGAPSIILFALSLTFASFDLIMSLLPSWFSTIFGVYLFAGSVIGFLCFIILGSMYLQSRGFLTRVITVEHYHDLGKLLFAFVFFWGYIAFSQFLLIWYSNIPEETEWFYHRNGEGWAIVSYGLLFGHLLIPFVGLISRNAKRNKSILAFWAVYMLAMHLLDLFWLIKPEYSHKMVAFGLIDLLCLVGLGGLWLTGILHWAGKRSLIAVRDPRLPESLAFENA